ncbi:MAG: saccharopine dehydrogenase NADP-binding domain-containing protein, partial [Phreatobacter sp.]
MRPEHLRILILGGYGTFGGRLARLLMDEPRLTLIIAGRSRGKAEAFCSGLAGRARTEPLACDRDGDLVAVLGSAAVDIVVDATGPFQAYGDEPYRVVKAALAAGISYIDLSDGAEFVDGITAFDAQAKARNCFVLSGASSFPVLTAAVARRLAADGTAVATITGGVAPSPHAGVGENVIRAIASYAGKPIGLRRDGDDARGYALTEVRNRTIAPPGHLPLRPTRFSLVDVPDLRELPRLWPEVRSVWMGAGPVPEIWHRGLNLLAWLVRWKILPSLTFLAPLFHGVIDRLAWGEHRGGMVVEMTGTAPDGRPVARSWHLLAEGDGGPFIPSMAVEALIRHHLDGRTPPAGARSAATALELEDYQPAFAGRGIVHGFRDDAA